MQRASENQVEHCMWEITTGDQVEGVHGVSDDLRDGPGEQEQREAN